MRVELFHQYFEETEFERTKPVSPEIKGSFQDWLDPQFEALLQKHRELGEEHPETLAASLSFRSKLIDRVVEIAEKGGVSIGSFDQKEFHGYMSIVGSELYKDEYVFFRTGIVPYKGHTGPYLEMTSFKLSKKGNKLYAIEASDTHLEIRKIVGGRTVTNLHINPLIQPKAA
jgi:hypothetical protein